MNSWPATANRNAPPPRWPPGARYADGAGEQGNPVNVADHRRGQLVRAAGHQRQDQLAVPREQDLSGDLAGQPRFTTADPAAPRSLHTRGALAPAESTGTDSAIQPEAA